MAAVNVVSSLSTLVEELVRLPPTPLVARLAIAASTLTDDVEYEFDVALMSVIAVSVEVEL